ncbi:MAG TPA: FKBP-type peptidyl-prolyl cis-trans isomerase [Bacteroidota bacterium]
MKLTALVSLMSLITFIVGCQGSQDSPTLKTMSDSVSYAIGLNIGKSIKSDSLEVNPAIIASGIRHAMSGDKPMLTDEQIQATMEALQKQMMAKQAAAQSAASEENKTKGTAFLAENKKKEGVVEIASGLQYKVIKEGKGRKPLATDKVKVHYTGTTIDGEEFDSSVKRGSPAEFKLNEVISGWTEGLQLMSVGSKYMLYVPSNLGYGDRGASGPIKPGSTLIFEVELLDIIK